METKTNPILEQLNQSLSETLSFLKQTSGTAIDFAKEQTPLYIQEMLYYNFTISLASFLVGVVVLLFSFYCLHNTFKQLNSKHFSEGKTALCVLGTVIFFTTGNVLFWGNTEWVKIKLAPRVYLVEQIKILLK